MHRNFHILSNISPSICVVIRRSSSLEIDSISMTQIGPPATVDVSAFLNFEQNGMADPALVIHRVRYNRRQITLFHAEMTRKVEIGTCLVEVGTSSFDTDNVPQVSYLLPN